MDDHGRRFSVRQSRAANLTDALDTGGLTSWSRHGQRTLADIVLPDIGMPDAEPLLPAGLYAERLQRLRAAMEARGYDQVVVWADREHSANLAYLSGFDPRFEEALLVVGRSGDPAVLVGNECAGMAAAAPLAMRPITFQDMSLPGQPRDASSPVPSILHDEGIRTAAA